MGSSWRDRVRLAGLAACWAASAVAPLAVSVQILTTPGATWDDLSAWTVGAYFALWPLVATYGAQTDQGRYVVAGVGGYVLLSFALIDTLGRANAGYGVPLLLAGVFASLAAIEPPLREARPAAQ